MSYNFRFTDEKGKERYQIAHDLGTMFFISFGHGLRSLSGFKCKEVLPHIRRALGMMERYSAPFKELNPNSWGSYDDIYDSLSNLNNYMLCNPDQIFEVS